MATCDERGCPPSVPESPKMSTRSANREVMPISGDDLRREDITCVICYQILARPVKLPCSHRLCHCCFKLSMEFCQMACPFCKMRLSNWWRKAKLEDKVGDDANLIDMALWRKIVTSKYLFELPEEVVTAALLDLDLTLAEEKSMEVVIPPKSSSKSSSLSSRSKKRKNSVSTSSTDSDSSGIITNNTLALKTINSATTSEVPVFKIPAPRRKPKGRGGKPKVKKPVRKLPRPPPPPPPPLIDLCEDSDADTEKDEMDSLMAEVTEAILVGMQGLNGTMSTSTTSYLKDSLKTPIILPSGDVKPPPIIFKGDYSYLNKINNCSPEIMRINLTKIPQTVQLLRESGISLRLILHPFKPQKMICKISNIFGPLRCKGCFAFINPWVNEVDSVRRTWKCNFCFKINSYPLEFNYDTVQGKLRKNPLHRQEFLFSTIDYKAPLENYSIRSPQAPINLFVFDVSSKAIKTGYLSKICKCLYDYIEELPSDCGIQFGFIAFDSALHFFRLTETLAHPVQMTVFDVDDIFLPCPSSSLVSSLSTSRGVIRQLLTSLPKLFLTSRKLPSQGSSFGGALSASQKILSQIGGRITSFIVSPPSSGPGSLSNPSSKVTTSPSELNQVNDFYRDLGLTCARSHTCVDIVLLDEVVGMMSISEAARLSGGQVLHFPNFNVRKNPEMTYAFEQAIPRYLDLMKSGYDALIKVRCSRGLKIHSFQGNFYPRAGDLIYLPVCNPDSLISMAVDIESPLDQLSTVCFQASLLYTSKNGERRIRVHTLSLPVSSNLQEILSSVDLT